MPPEQNPSCPYKLAALLDRFPRLRCVAAHLGGYRQWEHSLKALVGRDVWLDTSSCTPFIDPALLRKYIKLVKTGIPGVTWVKLDPAAEWPEALQLKKRKL